MPVTPACGLEHVRVTDWKSHTASMKGFDIDKYLADIDTVVQRPRGKVDLGDLCQGGNARCALPGQDALHRAGRHPHRYGCRRRPDFVAAASLVR